MNPEEPRDEKLYYASEVLHILLSLDNVYQSKPWYLRWMFKPWHDALQTAAMIIAGEEMLKDFENEQLLYSIEDFLDKDDNIT